jgi:hypothetical protein
MQCLCSHKLKQLLIRRFITMQKFTVLIELPNKRMWRQAETG